MMMRISFWPECVSRVTVTVTRRVDSNRYFF